MKLVMPYVKLVAIKLVTPCIKCNLSRNNYAYWNQYHAEGREQVDELEFPGLTRWALTETSLRDYQVLLMVLETKTKWKGKEIIKRT